MGIIGLYLVIAFILIFGLSIFYKIIFGGKTK